MKDKCVPEIEEVDHSATRQRGLIHPRLAAVLSPNESGDFLPLLEGATELPKFDG